MMKLTKNIRISFYILIPIVLWMASGLFNSEKLMEVEEKGELFSVQTILSTAIELRETVQSSCLSSDASQPIPLVDGILLTSSRDSELRSIEPSKITTPIFCLDISLRKNLSDANTIRHQNLLD